MARQSDHIRAEELMSAYLDKRLSAEEKNFFERHIASCTDCRAQLESTRSMVAALKALPLVRAPRSFVLPREMAKQPKRSFLTLYPALRLATVIAAMAFAILFAGDLLISRTGGGATPQQSLPAAAQPPAIMQASETARQVAPTAEPAAVETANDAAATSGAAMEPTPAEVPAPKAAVSETMTVTAAMATSLPTATPAATAVPAATDTTARVLQATVEATAESAVSGFDDQQQGPAPAFSVQENYAPAPPAIDPLRVLEVALLVMAIVLGIATLIVRRKRA
ncbi:MAG TPA: zf-HC2 domain-containing protein [Anaerolineae bacterium]|nr:zf-HC2 domain-containing protein [Anaerolineae bacterium]